MGLTTPVAQEDPKFEMKGVSADDMELLRIGKEPKMKRVYGFWTCKPGLFTTILVLTYPSSVRIPSHGVCYLDRDCRDLRYNL